MVKKILREISKISYHQEDIEKVFNIVGCSIDKTLLSIDLSKKNDWCILKAARYIKWQYPNREYDLKVIKELSKNEIMLEKNIIMKLRHLKNQCDLKRKLK